MGPEFQPKDQNTCNHKGQACPACIISTNKALNSDKLNEETRQELLNHARSHRSVMKALTKNCDKDELDKEKVKEVLSEFPEVLACCVTDAHLIEKKSTFNLCLCGSATRTTVHYGEQVILP